MNNLGYCDSDNWSIIKNNYCNVKEKRCLGS